MKLILKTIFIPCAFIQLRNTVIREGVKTACSSEYFLGTVHCNIFLMIKIKFHADEKVLFWNEFTSSNS